MDVEWTDNDIKKEISNNKTTLKKLRTVGNNQTTDIFSVRSNETDVPVKDPENVARYAPTNTEKKVKFMDSKKEKIFKKLEEQQENLDNLQKLAVAPLEGDSS